MQRLTVKPYGELMSSCCEHGTARRSILSRWSTASLRRKAYAAALCLTTLFSPLAVQSATAQGVNRVAQFDGKSFMDIPQPLLTNFTISAWIWQNDIQQNTAQGGGGAIFSWGSRENNKGVMIFDTRWGRYHFGVWAGNGYPYIQNDGSTRGQWNHLTLTCNNNYYTIYKDGEVFAQGSITQRPDVAYCSVGVNRSGPTYLQTYFNGKMDEVALFSRALSQDEVKAVMKQSVDTMDNDLEFYLPFDRAWNPGYDASRHHRKIKVVGNITSELSTDLYTDGFTHKSKQMTVGNISATAGTATMAAPGESVSLGQVDVPVVGTSGSVAMHSITATLSGDPSRLSAMRVDMATEVDNFATRQAVASVQPSGRNITLPIDQLLYGNARFYITGDFSDRANEQSDITIQMDGVRVGDSDMALAAQPQTIKMDPRTIYHPEVMTTGLIRNPAMGWVLYLDAFGQMTMSSDQISDGNKGVYYPDKFWKAFDDSGATQVASIFYMRVPWSFVEPTKGNYAWLDPESKFSQLVAGARARGLHLAFRFYVDSQDSYTQATPTFVFDDGASSFTVNGGKQRTPYGDDPVFLEAYERMLTAFAQVFGEADDVDYIDGLGLGMWGEGHSIRRSRGWSESQVLDKIASIYRKAFPHVLLGMQEGNSFAAYSRELTLPGAKAVTYDIRRRDSYGMTNYYTKNDRADYASWVVEHKVPLIAENGWNYFGYRSEPAAFNAYVKSAGSNFATVDEMLNYTLLTDVLPSRANTFDLRVPMDAAEWMKRPALVNEFVNKGGYRLALTRMHSPQQAKGGEPLEIKLYFCNMGVGILPNYTTAWGGKYKVALSLIDAQGRVVDTFVTSINPGDWLNTQPNHAYNVTWTLPATLAKGDYRVGYAIVDTRRNNRPSIRLAMKDAEQTEDGWYIGPNLQITSATKIGSLRSETTTTGTAYTLSGTRVTMDNDGSLADSLPSGVYVVNGRKVVH